MALQLLIDGNDHTSELVHESLVVNQSNDGLNSTCSFDLVDTAVVREDVWTVGTTRVEDGDVITSHITFSEPKVEVSVVDGATVYFAGILSRVNVVPMGVVDVRGTLEAETQILKCQCHDYSAWLEASVIDTLEEYVSVTDEAVIDDIFGKYVVGVDFATFVDGGAFTFRSISFENITVRQALDLIVARTDYVWYMDYSKKLHYSALEANTPAWHLSDAPDQVNSFSYLDPIRRETDATNLVNMVFIVGAEASTWFEDAASRAKYGDHRAIIRDARLYIAESIEARADALLAKFANPTVIYTVKTYEDDLRAGMNLRVVCAYYDLDETLLINRLMIKFPVDGAPIYELTLGGLESSAGTAARRLTLDQIYDPPPVPPGSLPIASRGWGHNLTFTSVDHQKVSWGAGTLTTAGGQTFTIAAGDTDDPGAMAAKTIVYLDLIEDPTSPHDLQMTTVETAALGAYKIMVAVCWPGIVAAGDQPEVLAGFQVFGSTTEVATYLNATNVIANSITANEIYCNTLAAISADMGALTAGSINILGLDGRIVMSSGGIGLYDGAANLRVLMDTDGGLFTWTSAEAGSPRIEIDSTEVAGYDGANVLQFQLKAADGKAYAGGGDVILDNTGITIATGVANANWIKWMHGTDLAAYIYGYYAGGASPAQAWMVAWRQAGDPWNSAAVYLQAKDDVAGTVTTLSILSDDRVHISDDLRVGKGLYVGSVGVDPDNDDIWVAKDVRIGQGLYVGSTGTDPPDNDIIAEGHIRCGSGQHLEIGDATHYFYRVGVNVYWWDGSAGHALY